MCAFCVYRYSVCGPRTPNSIALFYFIIMAGGWFLLPAAVRYGIHYGYKHGMASMACEITDMASPTDRAVGNVLVVVVVIFLFFLSNFYWAILSVSFRPNRQMSLPLEWGKMRMVALLGRDSFWNPLVACYNWVDVCHVLVCTYLVFV